MGEIRRGKTTHNNDAVKSSAITSGRVEEGKGKGTNLPSS